MKRKTCKRLTMETLKGHFLESGKNGIRINEDYLNDVIIMELDNNEPLYKAMTETRRRPEAIAWQAFTKITEDRINFEYCMEKDASVYYPASGHLKEFLNEYGRGYESIAESVRHVRKTREELREWNNRQMEERKEQKA